MCIILAASFGAPATEPDLKHTKISPFSTMHSCRRVLTVFFVTAILHDRFDRAHNGDTFWPPNSTFNAQKMVKKNSLGAKVYYF